MARPRMAPAVRQQINDQITAAATQVFGEKGYAAIGMRDIAKAAGVSTPQLYHFFCDKEALYQHCCTTLFARNAVAVIERCESIADPRERIRAFTLVLCETMLRDEAVWKLFQRQLMDMDLLGLDNLTGGQFKKEFADLTSWIEDATGRTDSHLVAYSIYAFTNGLIQYRMVGDQSGYAFEEMSDPEALAKRVLTAALPELAASAGGRKPVTRRG